MKHNITTVGIIWGFGARIPPWYLTPVEPLVML
jgi:hypothetical protein